MATQGSRHHLRDSAYFRAPGKPFNLVKCLFVTAFLPPRQGQPQGGEAALSDGGAGRCTPRALPEGTWWCVGQSGLRDTLEGLRSLSAGSWVGSDTLRAQVGQSWPWPTACFELSLKVPSGQSSASSAARSLLSCLFQPTGLTPQPPRCLDHSTSVRGHWGMWGSVTDVALMGERRARTRPWEGRSMLTQGLPTASGPEGPSV